VTTGGEGTTGDTNPDDDNEIPSDIAPVDKDLPQIVTDAIQNWQERTDVEPDLPATESELGQMERDLKEQTPNPENYPENNNGEALPDKDSESSQEGASEDGHEGDDRSDADGGDRDGGDDGGDRGGGG
jgi:hypothetical protein